MPIAAINICCDSSYHSKCDMGILGRCAGILLAVKKKKKKKARALAKPRAQQLRCLPGIAIFIRISSSEVASRLDKFHLWFQLPTRGLDQCVPLVTLASCFHCVPLHGWDCVKQVMVPRKLLDPLTNPFFQSLVGLSHPKGQPDLQEAPPSAGSSCDLEAPRPPSQPPPHCCTPLGTKPQELIPIRPA